MTILLPTARPLHQDDKAWSLTEEDMLSPDGKTTQRTQTVRVVRDDRLVEFTRVLGSAFDSAAGPFYIPSYNAHTVGQLMEYANLLRTDTGLGAAMKEHHEEVNVVQEAIEQVEMVREYMRRNPRTVKQIREAKLQRGN